MSLRQHILFVRTLFINANINVREWDYGCLNINELCKEIAFHNRVLLVYVCTSFTRTHIFEKRSMHFKGMWIRLPK